MVGTMVRYQILFDIKFEETVGMKSMPYAIVNRMGYLWNIRERWRICCVRWKIFHQIFIDRSK